MKFSLLRSALVLGTALTLASCGGGGKATYPIKVQVYNLKFPDLVLTTNGQDLPISGTSDDKTPLKATFGKEIEYGQIYDVEVKTQPKHQTCQAVTAQSKDSTTYTGPYTSTAGLLASIDIAFSCSVNTYEVGGTIKGLTGTGLVLINGSNGGKFEATPVIDNTTKLPTDIKFGALAEDGVSLALYGVPYGSTYGITILSQPTGQTCTISGGNSPLNNGSGTIDEGVETAKGVSNIIVTCTP